MNKNFEVNEIIEEAIIKNCVTSSALNVISEFWENEGHQSGNVDKDKAKCFVNRLDQFYYLLYQAIVNTSQQSKELEKALKLLNKKDAPEMEVVA